AWADAKKEGKVNRLLVTGCLSHRYRPELEKEIPEVDAWFGTNELPRLLKTMRADYKHELVGERLLTTPAHYAYFKIAEGCDRPCSFCAIPLMRGRHVSVPEEELISRAARLAAGGTKELILIAQDLTYYGLDLYKERRLPELLRKLSDVEGIEWIRLQYAYPAGFPLEVLDVMRERQNICNYLDMPLQHISDIMLKSMRRGSTSQSTTALISEIRTRVPDIALRTTLIAGYPGETQQDFEQMLQWVEDTRFDRLGCFTYSHEENTHAFGLTDNVPEEVKAERVSAIMDVQGRISLEKNEAHVGREMRVLIDRAESAYFVGRTERDSPEVDNEVLIPKTDTTYLRTGDFTRVRITNAEMFDLFAEPIYETVR
ncbi:MAG: 30S ribosomal protein S12 methylthiotransferase RimO, partial [Flavobacteriales bacterium]|nr:30S ribosomal protein S12 methylthiotransferase RimO [Flavobacteriales bacterium]